jgi:hypothetical protein
MIRVGVIIVTGLLAVGCAAHKTTRVPIAVNAVAMTEMRNTTSIVQKRQLASLNCRKSGYRKRTPPYYQCMRALIARDLQRTRDRADTYFRQAAKRGVYMERTTYRVGRCIET